MRHRDWDDRLFRACDELVGRPFEWGETDCASMVIHALEAMYPPDDLPLPMDRPAWATERAALRAYRATGGVEAALRAHGAQEVPLAFAQQGDIIIGLDEQGGVPGLAIVVSDAYQVASQADGVVQRKLRDLREADPDVTVLRPPYE